MTTTSSYLELYEESRERSLTAFNQGHLECAFGLFSKSLEFARATEDPILIDRAFCNLVAVEIELGRASAESLARLREILMRNADLEACRLAAYNLAQEHQIKKSFKKALFYAKIALDRANLLGNAAWIASSHNRIGNILIAESHFAQACSEYERALDIMPVRSEMARALILDNLGYCSIVQGDFTGGFRRLYTSLRTLKRIGARGFERYPHLSLCFALLEAGKFETALTHGYAALKIAEDLGDNDIVKNALYLLGEAANLSRNTVAARRHFRNLQERFFPNDRYLPDFLLAIDVRKLINLKA